jgi:predicted Zn-dependent protease
MILGLLAASKDPTSAQAMIVGGQAASAQSQLNYSRDMEREADRIGFNVATLAGYAPQGFVSMFQKLQQSSRLNDAGGFPYLRTHPLTTERIADMQGRVHQMGPAAVPETPTWDHAMVAARANVLSNAAVDALRNWQVQARPANLALHSESEQIGILYGASFAALKLREFELAEATLQRLQIRTAKVPAAYRLTQLLALEFALMQDQIARAVDLANHLDGEGRAVLLYRSQTETRNGQAGAAAQSLQTWLVDHPHDAQVWQQLSTAYLALGQTVAAVRAEAEVYAAQLDFNGALTRMRAAQEMVRKSNQGTNYVDASVVDTRVRELDLQVKEQALER